MNAPVQDSGRQPRRSGSLFWTFTGVFLLTILVGTLVQWLVAAAVLGPLELRDAKSRAAELATQVARDLEATDDSIQHWEIREILGRHRPELGPPPGRVVFHTADDRVISGGPPFRLRGRHRGPGSGVHPAHPEMGTEPLPESDAGPPPEPFSRRDFSRRFEVLARRDVNRGSARWGEVLIVRPGRPPLGLAGFRTRTPLLFLPIAVIASAVAGLFMVRLLVRRLGRLEALAARVAEGDLSARIGDRSGDEIGRVAEGLDLMTTRLADARHKVDETDTQRRRLLADVTHELATPLTSIRGYAETLLDPAVATSDAERARYIGGILEEAERMDDLIRDILDLSRLEGGVAPLTRETLDWAALCRNTLDRFEPRLRAAGLHVEWRRTGDGATIFADGRRMEQVIENLLENEIKYATPGGHVIVSLGPVPGGSDRLRLEVSDDGPGIPPGEHARVFERFYRVRGDRAGRGAADERGSGLGLAIVREIVERHGGTVRAAARAPSGLSIVVEMMRAGTSG